jgi:adhesin transport system outer membrane protein
MIFMSESLPRPARRPLSGGIWALMALLTLQSGGAFGTELTLPESHSSRLALKASVLQAIVFSAQLRGAQAQVSAAESELQLVQSQRLPQIQLRGQSRAKDLGGGLAPLDGAGQSLGVDVVTNLFDWGRLAYAADGQREALEIARAQASSALQELAYEVVLTRLELGRQQMLVRLGERYRRSMQGRVTLLESVVAVDVGRASELLQASARLMQADEWLDSARARGDEALLALQRLTGQAAADIDEQVPMSIASVPLQLLLVRVEDHPQLAAVQAQARSEKARGLSIEAASRPRLDWEIGKSTYENQHGLQQPWHTRLTLSWTAFDGGASKAARSAALYRSLAAQEGAEELRRQLFHEVRLADQKTLTAIEREQRYRQLGEQSAQIKQAFFEQWYHLGQRTLLDVLGADSEHFGHLSSEVSSRFDGYVAVVQGLQGAGALLPWLDGALDSTD